eukprot:GFUD01044607.1.p1 GENE.GFUD01044607.1~~GFUD01044607.1.p1  ORF type:complete len:153 (+),score=32.07 GFUD01044607.1:82-540(+)
MEQESRKESATSKLGPPVMYPGVTVETDASLTLAVSLVPTPATSIVSKPTEIQVRTKIVNKNDSDNVEETENLADENVGSKDKHLENKDASLGINDGRDCNPENDCRKESAASQLGFTQMRNDYSLRPNLPDMDWANCSWADPDDSLAIINR